MQMEVAPATGKARSARTRAHNQERLGRFLAEFAERRVESVTAVEAERWAASNSRYDAERAMFADARADGLVAVNPFSGLSVERRDARRHPPLRLTEAELTELIETAVEVHPRHGQVVAAMIGLAAWTGLRPGELYALHHSDVDMEPGALAVSRARPKDGGERELVPPRRRSVRLLPGARSAIARLPEGGGPDGLLLYTARGQPMGARHRDYYWNPVRDQFWEELTPARRRTVRHDFDLYDLRHFFGFWLSEQVGLSPAEIAPEMGLGDHGRLAAETYGAAPQHREYPPPGEATELARQLVEAASAPARVILFGSAARGEAGPDSDYDFLVIEREVHDHGTEWTTLREALGNVDRMVDILLYDEARAERRAKVPGTVVNRALREGRELASSLA
ncbi:MAG: nucleotidyltransferase domain-containing protein [Thermoleophilaceae bacterium]|nr:nucleotidyltransferase domain-containing protein [Thermoleophilaceae bacterium]